MERRVKLYAGESLDNYDLEKIQEFAQSSIDHIVHDAVSSVNRFAGFATVPNGVLNTKTSPGRYYSAGKVYLSDQEFTHDFTTELPVSGRKVCTLVVWGEEFPTDAKPIEILLNVDSNEVESQTLNKEQFRAARLAVVKGVAGPDPAPPVLQLGFTAVAQIVLSVTGVESVTMVNANHLQSSGELAARTDALEQFKDSSYPKIAGLAGDIAALTEGQRGLVAGEEYGRTLRRVAVLEAKGGIPDTAVDSFADFFMNDDGTDKTFGGYDAEVQEGIRFPSASSQTKSLALKNPLDTGAKVVSGVLLPAYDRVEILSTGAPTGSVKLNAYSYQNNPIGLLGMGLFRMRYGPWYYPSSNYIYARHEGIPPIIELFDPQFSINYYNGPGDFSYNHTANFEYEFLRNNSYWFDYSNLPYWPELKKPSQVPGYQVVQTFLNSNDTIVDALDLWFPILAADGSVTVTLCETEHGVANLDRTIAKVTLDRAALKSIDATTITLPPTFLTGGVRYAIVVLTAAGHEIGTVAGNVYPQGTFFYVLDGQYQQADKTFDLAFRLYAAKFRQSRAVIDLDQISLAGGIGGLDVVSQGVTPGATQMTFFVQVGGVWYPLSRENALSLTTTGGLQDLLPLRVVMVGTPEVMPMLSLNGSKINVWRPKTALNWVSAVRNLPGTGSQQIRATYLLEKFDAAHHTLTPALLSGAGYQTATAPSSISSVTKPDGSIERTVVWNLAQKVTSFRLKLNATTDNVLSLFHVARRQDYAL